MTNSLILLCYLNAYIHSVYIVNNMHLFFKLLCLVTLLSKVTHLNITRYFTMFVYNHVNLAYFFLQGVNVWCECKQTLVKCDMSTQYPLNVDYLSMNGVLHLNSDCLYLMFYSSIVCDLTE